MGAAKTGTTGAYAAVRDGLVRSGRDFYSLFEKYRQRQYRCLWRYAPDRTVLSKMLLTHPDFSPSFAGEFERRILLTRDPRDTLVSTLLYFPVNAAIHGADEPTIEALVARIEEKEKDPTSVPVRELLPHLHEISGSGPGDADFGNRCQHTIDFADTTPSHVLPYEDLVTEALEDLSDYLSFDVAARRSNGFNDLILRKGGSGDWRAWFTRRDVDHYRPLLEPYMERFGYPDEWETLSDPVLDPDLGSAYIRRSCRRRREQVAIRTARGETSDARLRLLRDRADDGAQRDCRELARILVDDPSLALTPSEPFERALFAARCGDYRGMKLAERCLTEGIATTEDIAAAALWSSEMAEERERMRTRRERDGLREKLEQSERRAGELEGEIRRIRQSRRYLLGDRIVRTAQRVLAVRRWPRALLDRRGSGGSDS